MVTSRSFARRACGASLLALVALTSVLVSAHESQPERELVVQLGPKRASVLLTYKAARGEAVELTFARFDVNRDGQLTGPEIELAAQSWAPIMLHALRFEIPGERPGTTPPQIKMARQDNGDLMLMALVTYELPEQAPEATRDFKVTLDEARGARVTRVMFQAEPGLALVRVAGREHDARSASSSPLTLAPGQTLSATWRAAGASAPAGRAAGASAPTKRAAGAKD